MNEEPVFWRHQCGQNVYREDGILIDDSGLEHECMVVQEDEGDVEPEEY